MHPWMSPDCPLFMAHPDFSGRGRAERFRGVRRGLTLPLRELPIYKKMPDKNKPVVSVSFYFYVSRI